MNLVLLQFKVRLIDSNQSQACFTLPFTEA